MILIIWLSLSALLPYLCAALSSSAFGTFPKGEGIGIIAFAMKKVHIILLILVAVAIGIIVMMMGDYTTYANFIEANQKEGKSVNVVGYLVKDKPMTYDPQKDPNYFDFIMTDKEGNEGKVIYRGSKPQDFERSEQLVVKGTMEAGVFKCSEISMKCPSKYVNDEITLKEKGVDEDGFKTVKSNI